MLKLPTPKTEVREIYADFPLNFDTSPISGDLLRVTNEEAIKQSIRNLLLTNKGERLYNPELGSDLNQMLFEQNTPDILLIAKERVKDIITTYEPRVNLQDVIVSALTDSNEITIRVTFYVLNRQDPINLTLTLERVR